MAVFYIVQDVADVGVVEQIHHESTALVLAEVLVVPKWADSQSFEESPAYKDEYHLVRISLASLSYRILLGMG